MKFSCIILAAGEGKRFGDKKQFALFNGKALYLHVYNACKNLSDDIIGIGTNYTGGSTRQESVRIGLEKVIHDRVVILEAARPLVSESQISGIGNINEPSVSFAIPSTDTIIYNNKHLIRKSCQRLQVPQAFDTYSLMEAHDKFRGQDSTDDTVLMKMAHNIDPILMKGGMNLFKVTEPIDLKILEVIMHES